MAGVVKIGSQMTPKGQGLHGCQREKRPILRWFGVPDGRRQRLYGEPGKMVPDLTHQRIALARGRMR